MNINLLRNYQFPSQKWQYALICLHLFVVIHKYISFYGKTIDFSNQR